MKGITQALAAPLARLQALRWRGQRFIGAFSDRSDAEAHVRGLRLVGYNHDVVAPIAFEAMCQLMLWDYPVLFWLARLLDKAPRVLDAGGHMGTKYRAFGRHVSLKPPVEWTVYDLPAIVESGRTRAMPEGRADLMFVDAIDSLPSTDLLLTSGLLQYLDIPFSTLVGKLPSRPKHLLINKVAMWDQSATFTLENFGVSMVPYQIRNRQEFLNELAELGYRILDEWQIDSLSNAIDTHAQVGKWESRGFCLEVLEPQPTGAHRAVAGSRAQ